MDDLSEGFQNLEVGSDLFSNVKFFISGEIRQEVIHLLSRGGADQSKYFSDFVTHLICGDNPEETDIIDAIDVYEVPAVTAKWVLMSVKLNRLVSTKPYLYSRPNIFASKIFCLSKVREDLDTLWALITYNGGKVQLNLDKHCDYLVTVDTSTKKYERAYHLSPGRIIIVTPDWVVECVRNHCLVISDLYHPRLIEWPKPIQFQHESTTAITGFEESENQDNDNETYEVASSTQVLLEKLKQRMPWNQPNQQQQQSQQQQHNMLQSALNQQFTSEQQSATKSKEENGEIISSNVITSSFPQIMKSEQNLISHQSHSINHQQILQKLQASQMQSSKSSTFSNISQHMTTEQQQIAQNVLQQTQQNVHSQRINQNIITVHQQPNILQSSQASLSQLNIKSHMIVSPQQPISTALQSVSPQSQTAHQSSPSIQQQTITNQQSTRPIVHTSSQSQQVPTQSMFQHNIGVHQIVNRPNLQQLRGQITTTQLQQQLLQQQQLRFSQQQHQQGIMQRAQLTVQQQQLLQLHLSQGQIGQARHLLQQNLQPINSNQNQNNQPSSNVPNQQILGSNQLIETQHINQNQVNQTILQNKTQQLTQHKLAQSHQLSQLLVQRQAQLNQRLNQHILPDQLIQNQQVGQTHQQVNQHHQQNQDRLLSQNASQILQNQQLKLAQQSQQITGQNLQLNQNLIDHNSISQISLDHTQQLGQTSQNIQQQQLLNKNQNQINQVQLGNNNQQFSQNQSLGQSMSHNQISQNLNQNQLTQTLGQNQQLNQGLNQNVQNQQQTNQGLNQNHQVSQGNLGQNQQPQQSLSQNQHFVQNQLLNQNESLGQGQQITQAQQLLHNQQLTPRIPPNQVSSQGNQNTQILDNPQLTDSPRQINFGLNHILNQQITQNQIVAQQRLNQNQLINQQLNQLNQHLNNNQLGHQVNQIIGQQISHSPITQNSSQSFGNILQPQQLQNQNQQNQLQSHQNQLPNHNQLQNQNQLHQTQLTNQNQLPNQNQLQTQNQLQNQNQLHNQNQISGPQILGSTHMGSVRQVLSGNQQIIQQQHNQNQPFSQAPQQDGATQNQVQSQQSFQLLLNQKNQFTQSNQSQQTMQQGQSVRPHLQQQLWSQQQSQTQVQLPRQTLNIQQGPRIQWSSGQSVPHTHRQFIQLDAQTHNQLQKMPPEQRTLFVQKLQQKQRQLLMKQAQQRGSGHIVIRGSVPPGLSPHQQVAWLQQQAKSQGLVIPNNLQQQTINSNALNQPNAGPTPVPSSGSSNIPQTPGLSPIQQNASSADPNQMKLKQIRLQQFSAQRDQIQKPLTSIQDPQANILRPVGQASTPESPVAVQDPAVGQSALIVNAKTKTALANMLSIRLQSGGSSAGSTQETMPEPSAAGTLSNAISINGHSDNSNIPKSWWNEEYKYAIENEKLMTAQHNASLNANSRPLDLIALQQRRAISCPNGDIIRPPLSQTLSVNPQNEPPQLQHSSRSSLPVQHRPGPFYGHNPNLKLPSDLYFLGCVFVVVEVDEYLDEEMPNWVKKIEKHGGEVEKQYCSRVTHVLCETQRHGVVMQALRDFKRCVTLYWFADIIKKKQLLPPWIALHVPIMYLDTSPCSKHLISVSGFIGEERGRIRQMLNYIGAKYTSYFSKHNTVLIADKLEGPKYDCAKKWGTPVVNIQWLTDILLGNFVAMNQMDNVVYQQYNDPANFSFDPKICPSLMNGWKMPINISQETYERVKRSASPVLPQISKKTKEPKIEQIDEIDEISGIDENMAVNSQYNILFSNVPDIGPQLANIVIKLGGSITKSHRKCTHLVMENLNRTNKLLFCIPLNVPILPHKWLLDSEKANKFLSEEDYECMFNDVDRFNEDYNCNLYNLMKKEKRNRLLEGRSFWVTPSVFPSERVVLELIELCGGVIEKVRRSAAQIEATNQTSPHSYFIVTHEDDIHLTADLLRNKKERIKYICNAELIFHAIMSQEIDVEPWSIKVIL